MMNILFLDIDPKMCAYAHCDEDVKQRILTYTKLLTAAHYFLDPKGEILKSLNPPEEHEPEGAWWGEVTDSNYQWLHDLWFWLHKEYWYRFDAMHDDWSKFYNKLSHIPKNITKGEFTVPPSPPKIDGLEDEIQNSIETFRQLYTKQCKENGAKWGGIVENMRTPPSWMIDNADL
jgi:hypothetical protein